MLISNQNNADRFSQLAADRRESESWRVIRARMVTSRAYNSNCCDPILVILVFVDGYLQSLP